MVRTDIATARARNLIKLLNGRMIIIGKPELPFLYFYFDVPFRLNPGWIYNLDPAPRASADLCTHSAHVISVCQQY